MTRNSGFLPVALVAFAAAMPMAASAAETGAPVATTVAKYSTSTTTIGTLMGDPAAKAVLVRIVPEFGSASGNSDTFERAQGMTLRELKEAVGAYAPNLLSDARLAELDTELAKLPAAK